MTTTAERKICNEVIEMLRTQPAYKLKVSSLAKRLGIGRSTFYFYFSSIDDVVRHIEDEFLQNMADEYSQIVNIKKLQNGDITYEDFLRPSIEYIFENLDVFAVLCGDNCTPRFKNKFMDRIRRVLNIVYMKDSSKSEAENILNREVVIGVEWHMNQYWALHPDSVTIEDMVNFYTAFLNNRRII